MKYRRLKRPRVQTPLPLALRQRQQRRRKLARARSWVGTLADVVRRIAAEALS